MIVAIKKRRADHTGAQPPRVIVNQPGVAIIHSLQAFPNNRKLGSSNFRESSKDERIIEALNLRESSSIKPEPKVIQIQGIIPLQSGRVVIHHGEVVSQQTKHAIFKSYPLREKSR